VTETFRARPDIYQVMCAGLSPGVCVYRFVSGCVCIGLCPDVFPSMRVDMSPDMCASVQLKAADMPMWGSSRWTSLSA